MDSPRSINNNNNLNNQPKIEVETTQYKQPESYFDNLQQKLLLETDRSSIAEEDDERHVTRDRFNNDYEYMLSILGFAAGYGSLWRFPYLIFKNGGGTFLIPYFILFFTLAIPMFYLETSLGQMYQKSSSRIFAIFHAKFRGFGLMSTLISFNISLYYNLILAYSIYFLLESFVIPLPWRQYLEQNPDRPWDSTYFYKDFLNISESIDHLGEIVPNVFICYILGIVIVFFCIQNGVKQSGRVAVVTATAPYILLFLMMVYGLFLDGASDGVKFLFQPNMDKIFDKQVWQDAAVQVIFQMSVGVGVLIIFGSYRPKKQDILGSSILIPFATVFCGFLSAIVVFSYLGNMAYVSGIPLEEIPMKGTALAFIVFPSILNRLPLANFWCILFFLILFFLGIDTQFAFLDSIVGTIEDELGVVIYSKDIAGLTDKGQRSHQRKVKLFGMDLSIKGLRFLLCLVVGCFGVIYGSQAGFYYLGFSDDYTMNINSLVVIFIQSVFFTWYRSYSEVEALIIKHVKRPTPGIFKLLNKFWAPIICGFLAVHALFEQLENTFNQSFFAICFGWSLTLYPYVIIIYIYRKNRIAPIPVGEEDKELAYLNYQTNLSRNASRAEIGYKQ